MIGSFLYVALCRTSVNCGRNFSVEAKACAFFLLSSTVR